MPDRLDSILAMAHYGFSLWRASDGKWQLNLKQKSGGFTVFYGATVDEAIISAKDADRFARPIPSQLRAGAENLPGMLKETSSPPPRRWRSVI